MGAVRKFVSGIGGAALGVAAGVAVLALSALALLFTLVLAPPRLRA